MSLPSYYICVYDKVFLVHPPISQSTQPSWVNLCFHCHETFLMCAFLRKKNIWNLYNEIHARMTENLYAINVFSTIKHKPLYSYRIYNPNRKIPFQCFITILCLQQEFPFLGEIPKCWVFFFTSAFVCLSLITHLLEESSMSKTVPHHHPMLINPFNTGLSASWNQLYLAIIILFICMNSMPQRHSHKILGRTYTAVLQSPCLVLNAVLL